ncbi:unnamed protein product [Psylliodes chrysocephalus]|uniref:Uncharacterized protein n=1 Tax=Psylliodes chrysocephalus TaxID=3402493 RepID=A0A9P0D8Y9_9CUCU|nr:unnamed protein product [Psylliodes chrysocephala]
MFTESEQENLCEYLKTNPLAFSTGINPFNKHKFDEADFLAASVTYLNPKLQSDNLNAKPSCSSVKNIAEISKESQVAPCEVLEKSNDQPSGSGMTANERCVTPSVPFVTPETVKPFPNVIAFQTKRKGRKKAVSEVLTTTPIRDRISEEEETRKIKKEMRVKREAKQNVEKNLTDCREHETKKKNKLRIGSFALVETKYLKKQGFHFSKICD